MSNNFEITVIDGENVVEVNNNPVEILTVGMQGPRGIQGIAGAGEVDPTVIENLQNQITGVQTLAQTNEMKIGTKADQVDLETAEQQIELNRLAILTKADITALAMLAQLVDTKADQSYVNQQILNLVGSAPEALNTIYELATAIQDNAGVINTLNQSVANRVRFDVATQALTEIQKQNARTNLGVYSKTETDSIATTPSATETVAGKAKIATTAIAQAGVNDTDFITAKKLRDALNVGGRIHATLYASTISSVTTILKSKNILSVVRTATGKHTITTASNMDDVNYTLLGLSSLQNSQTGGFIICENFGSGSTPVRTINSFQLETINGSAYVDAWVWGVSVVC